jgi:hypothetical protein
VQVTKEPLLTTCKKIETNKRKYTHFLHFQERDSVLKMIKGQLKGIRHMELLSTI